MVRKQLDRILTDRKFEVLEFTELKNWRNSFGENRTKQKFNIGTFFFTKLYLGQFMRLFNFDFKFK